MENNTNNNESSIGDGENRNAKKKKHTLKKKFYDFIDSNEYISKLLILLRIRDAREEKRRRRIIYVNNKKPDNLSGQLLVEEPLKYASNQIRTSKVNRNSTLFILKDYY